MPNFRVATPDYQEVKVTLGADVTQGDFAVVGTDTDGFYMADGANGELATVITRAKKVQVNIKASGQTWSPGQALYYESATPTVTTVSAGNSLIGYAIEDAASAATTGYMNFNGQSRFLKA